MTHSTNSIHFTLGVLMLAITASLSFADDSRPADQPENATKWRNLFDGETLTNWKITNFGGEGDVTVEDGQIEMDFGSSITGITFTGKELPRTNYEVSLEAKKVDGNDFFCALTFPVEKSYCSFVVGGWGGAVVGLSSIDDNDASSNATQRFINFDYDRWYKIRVRVTPQNISTWIDNKQVVDQDIVGHKISTRGEVDLSTPLGIAAYETRSALRKIRIRNLTDEEIKRATSAKNKSKKGKVDKGDAPKTDAKS